MTDVRKWFGKHPIWIGVFLLSSIFALLAWVFADTGLDSVYVSVAIQPKLLPLYVVSAILAFLCSDWLFRKRRYWLFLLTTVVIIGLMTYIAVVLSPYTESLAELNAFVHVISFSFVISFSLYLRIVKETIVRKQNFLEIKTKQQEAEIKILKQQLDPHFLFNTLNSLYLVTIEKSEEAPEMVLMLSDMLRYQIEKNKSEKIELAQEVKFLNNFVYFQKRRAAARMIINFTYNDRFAGYTIVPSLLIVPIENAFTHGTKFVNINLGVDHNRLVMSVENAISDLKPRTTGTGLNNLLAQLQYFYPNDFELKTHIKENSIFCFSLTVKLK